MTRQELKQYLKDNLKLKMIYSNMSSSLLVRLTLDGETITEATQRITK